MELIQDYNIFEFHDGQLWKQLVRVAMGIHLAPSLANIYIARRLDEALMRLGEKYSETNSSVFLFLKGFLMMYSRYTQAPQNNYIHYMKKLIHSIHL